jgi:hypothetical protein
MKDLLKSLEEIKKVDAPEFLFTRIQEKIKRQAEEWIVPEKAWMAILTFVLLLIINIYAIRQLRFHSNERSLAQAFQLMPDNNLYE